MSAWFHRLFSMPPRSYLVFLAFFGGLGLVTSGKPADGLLIGDALVLAFLLVVFVVVVVKGPIRLRRE